jgi:hypothetical protein
MNRNASMEYGRLNVHIVPYLSIQSQSSLYIHGFIQLTVTKYFSQLRERYVNNCCLRIIT